VTARRSLDVGDARLAGELERESCEVSGRPNLGDAQRRDPAHDVCRMPDERLPKRRLARVGDDRTAGALRLLRTSRRSGMAAPVVTNIATTAKPTSPNSRTQFLP
jgi:hypothetical protein